MNEWIETNWVCPFCRSKLMIKPNSKLTLSIKCKGCNRYYESIVNLDPPTSLFKARRRDRPVYTRREQFV